LIFLNAILSIIAIVLKFDLGSVLRLQQLVFPTGFQYGLINVTISGTSINIFTTPPYEVGGSKVYSGMLENMDECVAFIYVVVLRGPSCSSLGVYATQGFYIPPSHQGVSKGWMYATLGLVCAIVCLMTAIIVSTGSSKSVLKHSL
jgi:hypothetical protein